MLSEIPTEGGAKSGALGGDSIESISRLACAVVHHVMTVNSSKGDSWKSQPTKEHLRHAQEHIRKFLEGDDSEPHLEHTLTRLVMAITLALK